MNEREELFTVVATGGLRGFASPLAEAPIGPGHWAYPTYHAGPQLYAAPRPEGGYGWVTWEEAVGRGWSDRSGHREYEGEELERRFVALYYPAARRAWGRPWRLEMPRPLRLDRCRSRGEAELVAERFIPRQQLGFSWELEGDRRAWGWDDREIGYHEDCDKRCGCAGPGPGREYVLVVEFADGAAAARPHVVLERKAWLAELRIELAVALSGCPDEGQCQPACVHCEASAEEVDAAREWLRAHRRQVRAFERQAQRQAGAAETAASSAGREVSTW